MVGESNQERVGAGINLVEGNDEDCSICLEEIGDGTQKGISKLQCGHVFHLSCIGVAFNATGAMVCPNCRNVEDNQWRYSPARDDEDNGREEQEQEEDGEGEGGDDYMEIDDEDVDGIMQIIAGTGNNPYFAHMHHQLLGVQHVHHHHHHHHQVNHVVISNNPNDDLSAHHHAAPVLQQSHQQSSIRLLGVQIQRPSPVIRGISENLLPEGVVVLPSSGINEGNAGNHSHGHSVEHPFYCPWHSLTHVRQRSTVGVSLGFGSELNVPAGYSYHSNSYATSFPPAPAALVLSNSPISLPTMAGACLRNSMFSNNGQLQARLNQQQDVNPVMQLPPPPLCMPSSSTPPTPLPPPNHGTVIGDCLELHLNLSMDGGSLY